MTLRTHLSVWAPWAALAQSTIAVLGSLVASEILGMLPCSLCWWQRIGWFPLPLVFAVGLVTKELRSTRWLAGILSVYGLAFALYQVLLVHKVIDMIIPCEIGIPCDTPYTLFPAPLDVITIPDLSLVGFVFILVCVWLMKPAPRKSA